MSLTVVRFFETENRFSETTFEDSQLKYTAKRIILTDGDNLVNYKRYIDKSHLDIVKNGYLCPYIVSTTKTAFELKETLLADVIGEQVYKIANLENVVTAEKAKLAKLSTIDLN